MTVDPSRLLQMLEPTVRPGGLASASGATQAKPAFEERSFDDLLKEAKATTGDGTQKSEAARETSNPLGGLAGVGQIENATLRSVLAQARGAETGSEPKQT
jgi:hypothetical protein